MAAHARQGASRQSLEPALGLDPRDGHRLKPTVIDIENNTGLEVRRIHVDRDCRDHTYPNRFRIFVTGQIKRTTAVIKREMKRRTAIDPVIGYVKAEHRTNRNYDCGQDIGAQKAASHLNRRWKLNPAAAGRR